MGIAFLDAFSGSSPSLSPSAPRNLDADKVRKVLEGKAVVRVVDLDEKKDDGLSGLEEKMRGLAMSSASMGGPQRKESPSGKGFLWGL